MARSVNRRGFVRFATTSLAGLPLLLEACQAPSPTAGNTTPPAAAKNSIFPTYVPLANGPKPDYPSIGPQYEDAFDNYPSKPNKSDLHLTR